ncbi:FecR family protein [Echinicola shivajiensis]|uniref:FecR family protein n=1 Tax=Echinicola shivajiensis TaxID=1035916 RepID=UPI001BFC3FB2|nr:FecR family protein [Echinicola shivajiensis]
MAFKDDVFKELLEDEKFIQWLIAPHKESDIYWKEWVVANPEKAPVLKDIKAVVNAIEPKMTFGLEIGEKKEMMDQIMLYAEKNGKMKKLRKDFKGSDSKWTSKTLLAACFVIIAILTAHYFNLFAPEIRETPPVSIEKMISKKTSKGTKSSFYLPDGTLVKLNSSSKLEFPNVFSDSIREVRLVGQAFFEVTRNEAVPFIVRTEKMDVQVLGTSFDILSYPNSDRFEVAVATGKVAVDSREGYSEIITKSEMTRLDLKSGRLIKSSYTPIYHLGWKDGVLAFEDKSFKQVFEDLERWYGVDIQVSSEIDLKKKYTGKYDNQSLENVLFGMATVLDFQFEINGKQIKIFS